MQEGKKWYKSGTVRLALAAIFAAWATYFGGQIALDKAIMSTVGALLAILLRRGQGVPLTGLILAVSLLAGCASEGVTPSATGATGVGQYGALSGLQAGSTLVSMGGSVTVQVYPNPGVTLPSSIESLIKKIGDNDSIPMDKKVEMITKLSAPYGGVTVTVKAEPGDAQSIGSTGSGTTPTPEPKKPE